MSKIISALVILALLLLFAIFWFYNGANIQDLYNAPEPAENQNQISEIIQDLNKEERAVVREEQAEELDSLIEIKPDLDQEFIDEQVRLLQELQN